MTMPGSELGYIQNLRVAMILLVIAHHAGQSYGPTGGEWPVFHPRQAHWLGTFFAVNAAFFMALFFLIAGYFTSASLVRFGPGRLVARRAVRLGPPAALVGFLLMPAFLYAGTESTTSFAGWYAAEYIGRWQVTFAHTWFLLQLLVYTAIAAIVVPVLPPSDRAVRRLLSTPGLMVALVGVAAVTGLVRLEYPIDRWVMLAYVVPAEVAHLPQYVAAFLLGLLAGRTRLFETLTVRAGLAWLAAGTAAAALRHAVDAYRRAVWGSDPSLDLDIGYRIQTIWPLWETVICFGLCLGLPVLFRTVLPVCPALVRRLADATLATYVVHVFVLVPIQTVMLGSPWSPTLLFLVVAVLGSIASFAIALAWTAAMRGVRRAVGSPGPSQTSQRRSVTGPRPRSR